jgi:DNA-binding NtrC family response regulator
LAKWFSRKQFFCFVLAQLLLALERTVDVEAKPANLKTSAAGLSILIVDDEDATRQLCRDIASEIGLEVRTASTTDEALEILEQSPVDIVVTDLMVPELGGIELLKHIRTNQPNTSVMMLTQYGTIETAVAATQLGAKDYVTKPFHLQELRTKIERLVQSAELDHENRILREQLRTRPGFGGLIGVSAKMQRVYKMIEKVSQHKHPVLILGESGTGKELVARSIHFLGIRQNKPFVPVDCSGLVATLIESELFGHVKGAFTGAQHARTGLLEAGNGGTVFLDEIGDLPLDLQSKLLRVLQEREIRPVGAIERVRIDLRIIAATNRDLESAARTGGFRQDLYFRLNVVQIKLPPLRERKSDIPLLVNSFLEKFGDPQRPIRTISEDAMRRLMAYDWPGNVRELENAVERAVALGSGPILHMGDLPSNLQQDSNEKTLDSNELTTIEEMERRFILRALRETNGDKLAAARLLGIGKTTLYRKLKHYGPEGLPN